MLRKVVDGLSAFARVWFHGAVTVFWTVKALHSQNSILFASSLAIRGVKEGVSGLPKLPT